MRKREEKQILISSSLSFHYLIFKTQSGLSNMCNWRIAAHINKWRTFSPYFIHSTWSVLCDEWIDYVDEANLDDVELWLSI